MKRGLMILTAVILTAKLGTVQYNGHRETFYNLPMNRIEKRANDFYGMENVFEIREDGVKTYNGFVICAVDKSIPYGTVIETSRGIGLALDYHTTSAETVDLATNW